MPRSNVQRHIPCQLAKIPGNRQTDADRVFLPILKIAPVLLAIFVAMSLTACGGGGGGGSSTTSGSSSTTSGGSSSTSGGSSATASTVDTTMMTLTWTPVPNADLGYLVYYGNGLIRNPTPASTLLPKAKATFNAQADFGLSSGDYACFWVQAVNSAGMSGLSEPVCGLV